MEDNNEEGGGFSDLFWFMFWVGVFGLVGFILVAGGGAG
jgi:hypothetical protein